MCIENDMVVNNLLQSPIISNIIPWYESQEY